MRGKIFPLLIIAAIIGLSYATVRIAGSNAGQKSKSSKNVKYEFNSNNEDARKGIFAFSDAREAGIDIKIEAEYTKENKVEISWNCQLPENLKISKTELLRSGSPISAAEILQVHLPVGEIALLPASANGKYYDETFGSNYFYYYALKITMNNNKTIISDNAGVKIPGKKLPSLTGPSIHIDKKGYTLTVLDNGVPVKRYPMVMGSKPKNRKLIMDMASTPEGIYEIIVLQPNATYYRAYDINYPNKIDEFRYKYAAGMGLIEKQDGEIPPIGGEIQIHGKGISYNWTAGCIALRNEDMDELFAHPEIAVGTSVVLTGYELTPQDIAAIRNITASDVEKLQKALKKAGHYRGICDGAIGSSTMRALGDFQVKNKLPLTCQPDVRTLKKLGVL